MFFSSTYTVHVNGSVLNCIVVELGGSSEDSSAYSWANEEQPENQERRKGLSTVCISMRMFQYFFTCLYTEKVYWKKSCLVVYICCVNVYPRNWQTFYSMYVW